MTPDLLKDAVSPLLRARGTSVLLTALLSACGGKDVRPPEVPPAAGDCAPLRLERGVDLEGFRTDRFEWRDADCKPRSASLVRNDAVDPRGWTGGYLRRYTYDVAGATRVCEGSDGMVPGWGIVTSHLRVSPPWGNWTERIRGTWRTVFEGRHHALHEFRWPMDLGGHAVDVTVHYLFATGRSHPLYAITHDASGAPPDVIEADVRSPYGDILFDGAGDTDISGVGWGDRYRFVTRGPGPLTRASGWDYREPNVVPYTRMWIASPDAEMGVVQTQTWMQKPAGGYWQYPSWGQVDEDGPMPDDWNWTYQLNQYELPAEGPTRSHRMAWGSNFGAVGFREYPRYGDDAMLSGYPYQSYSVFLVLGTHTSNPVLRLAEEVEAWQGVRLTATEGRVVDRGPGGVGRDDTVVWEVPGYNPVYATWEAELAASNRAALRFETNGRALVSPVVVLRGYSASTPPALVSLDGQALTADVDYFASVDDAGNALWLTLHRTVTGSAALRVE
ncbi:hypothetical protein [Corallococcus macrosporus]|uniref:Putative lipoprotein n=1 Tax=Myxococcus fulvus (strain ATCC BAA-855 / HW-1) TaxID=483219 RepID=F8C7F6_MYXFH|nr:hypothetical protein [Corallococcus macrosporus]AEI63154.1 putative lipoprotein [Corallococcus macrosporus]